MLFLRLVLSFYCILYCIYLIHLIYFIVLIVFYFNEIVLTVNILSL